MGSVSGDQGGRQRDRQRDTKRDTETGKHRDIQIETQTKRHRPTVRQSDILTGRLTESRDTKRDRQIQTKTEKGVNQSAQVLRHRFLPLPEELHPLSQNSVSS